MPQTAPVVTLDNVDVDIDGQPVLHAIQFSITAGRHWGITGGNGSGKSTLLALLAGRRWPAPGRGTRTYDFGDGPERDAITARERIALVGHELQDLYVARRWNFRARDIVHSGLTRTDIPERRANAASKDEAEALLESMDLGHLADRRLLELSRGEQRRVLITRSLAFKPALLLLDEPASGLDQASRAELEKTLKRAAEQTLTVTAAHQADELPQIVTDLAVLEAGRLQVVSRSHDQPAPVNFSAPAAGSGPIPTDSARRVVIELENASVWLGDREVLKSIGWRLLAGEQWLITGENGAGKSTFLRLLNGEIRPAVGGHIAWPGLGNPTDVWALRRKIALVSPELQARYRYPSSVFDAVASGFHASIGLIRPLTDEQQDRVHKLLAGFDLNEFSERLLSSLSYGQRHRALIARTLATNPRVLLLDEPWEGLDAKTSDIVAGQIALQMESGTQIVCASHVGPRGLELNRQMQLQAGRIVNAGGRGEQRESSASAQSQAGDSPRR
jgi:molybdate transport system ATP-binding protein